MLRQASSTPCPLPTRHRHIKRDSILSTNGDESTANIDFTAAFPKPGASLKNAKPRRPQKANAMAFAIHEDDEPRSDAGDLMKAVRRNAGASAIAQPPQRPKRNVGFAASTSLASANTTLSDAVPPMPHGTSKAALGSRLSQAPRRPILKVENAPFAAGTLPCLPEDTIALPTMDATTMFKPARRGTIYIPSEDTTMPSMYMGMFSPIKDLDAAKIASVSTSKGPDEFEIEAGGIAAQMLAKKQKATRNSMIAMSPKRGPLQVSVRSVQESTIVEDRWGQGGGKENVPPGQAEVAEQKVKSKKRASMIDARHMNANPPRRQIQQNVSFEARPSRPYEQTASSMSRSFDKKPGQRASAKPIWNAGPRLKTSQPILARPATPESQAKAEEALQEEIHVKKPSIPTRFVMPNVSAQRIREIYPVLAEDLANLSLYEDNWLNHQEVAITQLVNNLFGASAPAQLPIETEMLRFRLLERYGNAEKAMLHKRLQASLLYGALSAPLDVLKGAMRLSNDLGRRKAFTDLWLDTYDLSCLRSALEVVVGRQCVATQRTSSSSRSSSEGQGVSRRALQAFIETFLIRNEDGTPGESSSDLNAWSYQRTLLRSLMLILLLDAAKSSPNQLIRTCLFQPSSEYKSSVDVVRALFQLLNPSAGDPIRALSHMGYTVTHVQYPLEEYSYCIENIAVDLRDGVCLTRLVELLLYPSASLSVGRIIDSDATTTVILPTGEILSMIEGEQAWPLSQHLKFPCHGRATKLYNVQIALSALQGVKGMTALVQDVQAEDIVDGFREKTVKLLWGLTSKWGLNSLVDWDDLEREIKRLCRGCDESHDNDFFDMMDDEEGYPRHKILLKSWAQAIASRSGLVVKNLTTSFADGRVFEAIVDEYQGYLASDARSTTSRPLCERLRALGCSEQFALLFSTSPNRPHLFDRDFVLAALAFLGSRLLGPTKGVRAAVTIQKAWRSHWSRVLDARKVRLREVAQNCAQTVCARKQVDQGKKCGPGLQENSTSIDRHKAGLGSNGEGIASPAMSEADDIWLSL
ncbi:hypothetical protein H2200_010055 [Cladophialophora chaetospira]|uniref:Calponin-homology (CH) domain-containing protein n=1 Tax=Cladophialophora chaetospira TaxID=386627 RepID=A0AA38X289_9EURO|nr:hypothetical protein H2200_010055 [Cladophialophora chaetospira]